MILALVILLLIGLTLTAMFTLGGILAEEALSATPLYIVFGVGLLILFWLSIWLLHALEGLAA